MLDKVFGVIPKEKKWAAIKNTAFFSVGCIGAYLMYLVGRKEIDSINRGCEARAKQDSIKISDLQGVNKEYRAIINSQNQQGQELLNDFFRQKNAIENIKKN